MVWDTLWAFPAVKYGENGVDGATLFRYPERGWSVDEQLYLRECSGARGPARMRCGHEKNLAYISILLGIL